MKASTSRLRTLLSHLCAVAIGALAVLQWEAIVVTTVRNSAPRDSVPTNLLPASHRLPQQRYSLLPILVLEKPPKNSIQLHKLLLNSKPRIALPRQNNLPQKIRNGTTQTVDSIISVGPFHVFYPASRHEQWHQFLKAGSSDLLKDNTFVRWEPVANTTNRREILFSLKFWERVSELTDKVLMLDGSAVLCGNPSSPLLDFVDYDWIGAAWKWAAEPDSPLRHGGNGALSIRSPRHLMTILQDEEEIPARGNEDMWFVNRLGKWAKQGDTRRGVPSPRLPSYEHQIRFAVEEVAPPSDIIPVGVYHLMKTMDFKDRNKLLQRCPEASSLFNPLHEPRCVVLQCPKNMSIGYFDMKKQEEQEKGSVEKCDILYHPVVAVAQNWSNPEGHHLG